MEADLYSPKEAAAAIGCSKPVLRVYCTRPEYARLLSTEAAPATPGTPRRFRRDDLRVLAYIFQTTSQGATHDQVAARIAAGALDAFDWQPPEAPQERTEAAAGDSSAHDTSLIPMAQYAAAQTLLAEAQRREAAAVDQVARLQEEIVKLSRELGQAQGRESTRRRAPRWWRALFGSSDSQAAP